MRNLGDFSGFPDVNKNNFFAPYILFAKYAGITNSYANGNFGPDNTVTRGEFTKIIWKTLRENKIAVLEKYENIKNGNLEKIGPNQS